MDYVPFLIFLLYLYMYSLCDNKRFWTLNARFYGLSRQVVLRDRENKYDFVKTQWLRQINYKIYVFLVRLLQSFNL